MSRWTFVSVGLGEPHQLGTAWKSADCDVRAVILKAPVPTRVAGFAHQLSKSFLTTFWSTSMPVLPWTARAGRNQPAELDSWTFTVYASGALSPVMVTDGSLFSSSVSSAAPVAWLFEM